MTAPLFGILNVNKSQYVTSRAVVNRIQTLVKPAKTGHAGTLDPMATGVLLIAIGRATRLVSRMQQLEKVYRARFVFGQTSNTDDAFGEVTRTGKPTPTTQQVSDLLPDFVGEIRQVPPAFSAVHVNGQRAYKLARQGKEVELEPRSVRIDRLELVSESDGEFEFEIECGSGTYIRSIARDLGERLGCGGLMSSLERTRIGSFTIEQAIRTGGGADPRVELTAEQLREVIQSPLKALPGMAVHNCDADDTRMIRLGRAIAIPEGVNTDGEVALVSNVGKLIAVGVVETNANRLRPRLVFDSLQ